MEKSYSKNWLGYAFLGKILYESLSFWKKWTASTNLAPSVIFRFLTKMAKNAEKILEFQKNYILWTIPLLYPSDGFSMIFFSGQPYNSQSP